MFGRLKKIARGVVGGLTGIITAPVENPCFWGPGEAITIMADMGFSLGFGFSPLLLLGPALIIPGLRCAAKCAYSSYHLGLIEGIKLGSKFNLSASVNWAELRGDLVQDNDITVVSELSAITDSDDDIEVEVKAEAKDFVEEQAEQAIMARQFAVSMQSPEEKDRIARIKSQLSILINTIVAPSDFKLLSEEEISALEKMTSHDAKLQKKLQDYQSILSGTCPITQADTNSLDDNNVVTAEKKDQASPATIIDKVELNKFLNSIFFQGNNPADNTSFDDHNVYLGFPTIVKEFVIEARQIIAAHKVRHLEIKIDGAARGDSKQPLSPSSKTLSAATVSLSQISLADTPAALFHISKSLDNLNTKQLGAGQVPAQRRYSA